MGGGFPTSGLLPDATRMIVLGASWNLFVSDPISPPHSFSSVTREINQEAPKRVLLLKRSFVVPERGAFLIPCRNDHTFVGGRPWRAVYVNAKLGR